MLPVNPLAQHALKRDAYHLLYFEEARELEDPQKPQRLDDFQRKGGTAVEQEVEELKRHRADEVERQPRGGVLLGAEPWVVLDLHHVRIHAQLSATGRTCMHRQTRTGTIDRKRVGGWIIILLL